MSGLLRVHLFDDEILSSYVSRTARANGWPSMGRFCRDMGLDAKKLCAGDAAQVAQFAAVVNVDDARLAAQAFAVSRYEARFRGEVMSGDLTLGQNLQYCPRCWADDEQDLQRLPGTRRYKRVAWQIRSVTSCPKHGYKLTVVNGGTDPISAQDLCKIIDRHQLIIDLPERVASQAEQSLAQFIAERLLGMKSHGEWLDDLPLATVIDFSFLLGASACFGKNFKAGDLDEEQQALASGFGFEAQQKGIDGIFHALDLISSSTKISGSKPAGGKQLYGNLYIAISKARSKWEYDKVRTLIRRHATVRFPLLKGAKVFGPLEETGWISIAQLAREEGAWRERVRDAVQRNDLSPTAALSAHAAETIRSKLRSELAAYRGRFTHNTAAKTLGCSFPQLQSLEAAGFLDFTSSDDIGRRQQTTELIRRIREAVNSPVQSEMRTVEQLSRETGLAFVEVLRSILDGEFGKVATGEGKALLRNLFASEPSVHLMDRSQVSTGEAARMMGVTVATITAMARNGILTPCSPTQRRRRMTICFSVAQIEELLRKYVTVSQAARLLSVTKIRVAYAMRKLGLPYAFEDIELHVKLIHREDLGPLKAHLEQGSGP